MEHLILSLMFLHFAKNLPYFCLPLTLEEMGNECCTHPWWLWKHPLRSPSVGNIIDGLAAAAVLWIHRHVHAGIMLPMGHSQPVAEPSRVTHTDPILQDRGPVYGRFWPEGSQSAWMQTSLQLGYRLRLPIHPSTQLPSLLPRGHTCTMI